jgi:hypothetical protein
MAMKKNKKIFTNMGYTILMAVGLLFLIQAKAGIPDANGVYTGCYLKSIGTVRVIDTAKTTACTALETKITWNSKGIPGSPGLEGTVGPAGPQGVQGIAGVKGETGATVPTSAGKSCPLGQVLIGFDINSNLICKIPTTLVFTQGNISSDADGDGIPDQVDECPSIPQISAFGITFCPTTIYQIRTGLFVSGHSGSNAIVNNSLVNSIDGTLLTLSVDPFSPEWMGEDNSQITVNADTFIIPLGLSVGDHVNVYGTTILSETGVMGLTAISIVNINP